MSNVLDFDKWSLNEKRKKKGLWDNIHAKRKRDEKPAKKGDPDYPDKKAWDASVKESHDETPMAMEQMKEIVTNIQQIVQHCKLNGTDLPAWVQDKISVANHSMESISDWFQSQDLHINESAGIPDRYKKKGYTKVGVKKLNRGSGNNKWSVLARKKVGGKTKYRIIKGGYKGMEDYTQHKDAKRKKAFWDRMGGKNSSKAKDPFSALYWHKRFGTW